MQASQALPDSTEKAIVLLSGGLDSTTCLTLAQRDYQCYPLTCAYGQRHRVELEKARSVATHFSIPPERHLFVDLGRAIRGSALTGDAEVPT
ncbi:MAG: 7-cyano-7-deazaguanine synthase, partial [Firmicutes bacterium]|nr:7-cyano-7-deazaguanine synthase [Bacillota bacterium]